MSASFPPLPVEEQFTDAEFTFRDDEPRRLFPENQDSNWGLKRKFYSDVMNDIQQQLYLIYHEMFPQTSTQFLDEWERVAGLPRNPIGKTLEQRRALVLARLRQGPFTRPRRHDIVDSFINVTFGEAIKLLPEGVAMIPEGVPIYNDVIEGEYFKIIEQVESFYYEIQILSTISIDEIGLRAALDFVQYSGLHYEIVYVDNFGLSAVQESDVAFDLAPTMVIQPVGAYGLGPYGRGQYGH